MTGPTRDAYGACDPRAHGALGCDDGATNEAPARNGDAMATETPKAVFIVLTNCTDAAREDEFNEWYNNIHLPDVLTTPGIIRATRLGRADETPEGQARYAALYELDTDDVASVQQALTEVMDRVRAQGRIIDCLEATATGYYTPITVREQVATPA